MKMEKDDPQRLNIEHIFEAGDRAAHLTKDLLLFSRKQFSKQTHMDMNVIVRRMEKFLKRIIGEDIEFRTSIFGEEMPVLGDAHQLEQVLMNLATNAHDAMPTGGIFSVTTEQLLLDHEFVAVQGYRNPGAYALLTASDTGKGI